LKLKANGGGVVRVTVEVVTVDPLGVVLHTPLAGVTDCALTGNARQPAEITTRKAVERVFPCIMA
jgi:acetamidase/formamidase